MAGRDAIPHRHSRHRVGARPSDRQRTLADDPQGIRVRERPATGAILWQNKLKGLGTGFVTIAGAAQVRAIARRKKQDDDAAGAGAVVVAMG